MAKNLTIAFDIDGTLIDKSGQLDLRVLPMFSMADLDNTNFIFVTGGTLKSAQLTISKINEALQQDATCENHGKTIKGYIATNSGGMIFNPEGEIIYDASLGDSKVFSLTSGVRMVDKESVMIYVANDTYYIENQDDLKTSRPDRFIVNSTLMHLYKKKESKKGEFGLNFGETKKLTTLEQIKSFEAKEGKIRSVYVVPTSVSKDKKVAVYKSLVKNADDLAVYKGFAIEIPSSTKTKAIQFIIDNEIDNPKFAKDIKKVVYFGDSINDVEMLKTSDLSFARGEQAKKEAVDAAKCKVCNCMELAKALYKTDYFDSVCAYNCDKTQQQK